LRSIRSLICIAVLLVPLLYLGIGANRFVTSVIGYLNSSNTLAAIISREASRSLNRDVHVSRVTISGSLWSAIGENTIDLAGVSVSDASPTVRTPFACADHIIVRGSIRKAIQGDAHTPYVSELKLLNPAVHIAQDSSGKWNFSDLSRPRQAEGRQFTDRIVVSGGQVTFDSAKASVGKGEQGRVSAALYSINGIALLGEDHSATVDIHASPDPGIGDNLQIRAITEPQANRASVHVEADKVQLKEICSRYVPERFGNASAGEADIKLDGVISLTGRSAARAARGDLPLPLFLTGSLLLRDGDISTPYVRKPLHAVNALIKFTDTSAAADVRTAIDGIPLHVSGSIAGIRRPATADKAIENLINAFRKRGPDAPIIHVRTAVADTNLNLLYRDLMIDRWIPDLPAAVSHSINTCTAQGSVMADLDGQIGNIALVASAHLNRARYDQVKAYGVDVALSLRDGELVGDISGNYAGGSAVIRTRLALDGTGTFKTEGHGKGLKLTHLGFKIPRLEDGFGDIDIAVEGKKGITPSISSQVELTDIKINGQVFTRAYCEAESAARKVVIRSLRVDDPKGFAFASGQIDLITRHLDIQAAADGMDIHSLVEAVSPAPPLAPDANVPTLHSIDGVAYFRKGTLGGTLDDPVLSGEINAFGLSAGKFVMDKAIAAFKWSSAGLIISRGSLERYPSIISFSGNVVDLDQPQPDIDFTVRVRDLDLRYLGDLAGVDPKVASLDGTVSTDAASGIRIYGTGSKIHAVGEGGQGKDQPFSISLRRAAVNGLRLSNAYAEAFYDPAGLHVTTCKSDIAGGSFNLKGSVSREGDIALTASGTGMKLSRLTAVLPDSRAPELEGTLRFAVSLGGTLEAPTVTAQQAAAEDVTYRGTAIGSATVTAEYADKKLTLINGLIDDAGSHSHVVTIPRVTLNLDTSELASPGVNSADAIKIDNLKVSRVGELVNAASSAAAVKAAGLPLDEISGALTARVELKGTLSEPTAAVKLDTHNITIRDYAIRSFTGSATVTREGVTAPSAMAVIAPSASFLSKEAGGQRAAVEDQEATLSVRDFSLHFGGDVRADLDVSNLNLAFVQAAAFPTAIHPLTGVGDKIGILVAGTVQAPVLDFSVSLSNVGYMDRTFERVEIDHARVEEGKIALDDLRITRQLSKTKTYQASVSGTVRGFTWTAPFLPDTAQLDVTAELPRRVGQNQTADLDLLGDLGITAFKDSKGSFSGILRVGGSISSPRLQSGVLTLTADKIKLPGMQTGIVDLNARVSLADDLLHVDSFTARAQAYDRKGQTIVKRESDPFTLTGSIPVGYNDAAPRTVPDPLTLSVDNLYFDENPLPGSRSGSLTGTGAVKVTITRSLLRPVIGGTINVSNTNAALPSDFAPPNGASTPPAVNPRFDLTVNFTGKNVRLRNTQLDAQVGGFLSLRGDLAAPILHGRIALLQGSLKVPPRRFDLLPPGSIDIDFGNNAVANAGLDVRVNLTARTKLTAVSAAGVRKLYTVTVTANGPLTDVTGDANGQSKMRLDFITDPNDLAVGQQAMSERLVTALFGVDTFNRVGHDPGQTAITALTNIITGTVLPGQFDKLANGLGLEQFELSYDPVQQLSLTVSRQIIGPIYVTYNRGLTSENKYYDLKTSLRLRGRYQFSYDYDDQRISRYLLEGVWRF
jgi:hypothetical protein